MPFRRFARRGCHLSLKSDQRTVLFFARDPHNVVVYERVLRRLLDDSRIRLFLSSKNRFAHPPNALFDGFALDGALKIGHRIAALRKFDLYISPDIHLLARRSRVKVHTFHGISIKGKAYSPKVLPYDRLFLIGPYQRRRFAKLGVLDADDRRFVDIGMPKTDAFFDGSLDRAKFLQSHGLDPGNPTILYAPTWRPESSLHGVGEELIRSMRGGPYNFLVKLHDLSYQQEGGVDWRSKLAELRAPNVVDLKDHDVSPALFAADLLISDASSVANEFTLLDRPIVFIDVPDLYRKYEATIDREDWGQKAGAVAKGVPEIHRCVESALARPEQRREIRKKIATEGFYNPGGATEAALEAIYRLVELDSPIRKTD
ncbi:CDP-glycerol glycerophosphotransferase family protein [Candidatus Sumerlaeota bacterium]|nr:CDP-glycerol glycerophosphotransferase family protein [Candidatus Sumerlaeota bacterium]